MTMAKRKSLGRGLDALLSTEIRPNDQVVATGLKEIPVDLLQRGHYQPRSHLDMREESLEELANTNVCVICAGAKAILDIGLTLEYLETKGVPVIGYKTSELPAFYSSESGFDVDYKIDSAQEIAEILKTKWSLSIDGGVLVTNPIPVAFELESSTMNEAINQAIIAANNQNITGKEITPYLLSKVNEITQGKSLDANIKLIQNNANLAAKIALHYSKHD